ncbi:MAG: DNA polymerase III subunit epsilon [Polaromonas sp.]|nr:DNA polymerase III subunit epsilon [Polaromonas sp.]
MHTQEQLGLGFGDGSDAVPPSASTPARKTRPRRTLAAKPASEPRSVATADAIADTDLEAMARTLEKSPDYRVLRRLVPTLCFEREPAGAVVQVLVLDTETTGLDASRDQVIELALLRVAVDTATGLPVGPVQVYDGLEDPGRGIPAAITEITGITDAMVRGQRLDEARIAELADGIDLVVAHNAGFDRPFVEARLPRFAQLAWACSFADLNWKARGQSSARLESLALACGQFYSAHRAETDCHALLSVLARPLAAFGPLPGTDGSAVETGLAALLVAAGQVHHRLQATGAPFEAKDALKARGYRWDAQQRVWCTTLRSEQALRDELAWLAEAVYGGHATRVRVEALDARQRYSPRAGTTTMCLVAPGFDLGE